LSEGSFRKDQNTQEAASFKKIKVHRQIRQRERNTAFSQLCRVLPLNRAGQQYQTTSVRGRVAKHRAGIKHTLIVHPSARIS